MTSLAASIVVLTILHLIQAQENEIVKAMLLNEVIPDVLDEGPKEVLKVTFDNGAKVNMGNELTPTQVQNQPHVEWDSEEGAYYTLLMTEPDAPSRADKSVGEWQHWLVGNIAGNDVAKGTLLSGYQGSGPMLGTGLHRYVYLLFKQPHQLEFDEKFSPNTTTEGRPLFSTRKFMKKYNLETPIAGNFYEAQYDEIAGVLLAQLGF
uniref:Phosphatidylethanolamine-binding protein n=1 Tax=Stomoxys calcitrans TaxID=35570 RepID=A0A1I8QCD4_STOCA